MASIRAGLPPVRDGMILTCPNCTARFLIDPTAIGANGRTVRCGKCRNAWFATQESGARVAMASASPADPLPAFPVDAKDGSDDRPRPAQEPLTHHARDQAGPARPAMHRPLSETKPSRPPRRWPARMAWLALIAALAGIGAAASRYPERVIAVFPVAEPIYAAVGISYMPSGFGLNLTVNAPGRTEKEGQTFLLVSGRIENTTRWRRALPDLRATLFDAEDRTLQGWTFPPPVASLPANGRADFKAEFADPAKTAGRLSVSFHETR